jgi:hypothetical protein
VHNLPVGRLATTALVLLVSSTQVFPASADTGHAEFSVSALAGVVHRDFAIGFDAFVRGARSGVRIGLGAPMRFGTSGVREQDWNEVTDYGRIVEELSYRSPGGLFSIRLAPIAAYDLGAGNLVSRYYSTVDPDHWNTGVTVAVTGKSAGGEAFLDSFLGPAVTGARAYVRPFEPFAPGTVWGRFEIAGSVVADFLAPETYERPRGQIVLADSGLPNATRTRACGAGLDLLWPIRIGGAVQVTPRFAFSGLGDGTGIHAGFDLVVTPAKSVKLGLGAEFRRLGAGYVAPYFDTLYMAERWDFRGQPKAASLDAADRVRMGMAAQASIAWGRVLSWWLKLDLDQEPGHSLLRTGLDLAFDPGITVTAHLAERGLPTAASVFTGPDNLLGGLALHARISGDFSAFAAWTRDVAVATSGSDRGLYRPSDTALAGVRFGAAL